MEMTVVSSGKVPFPLNNLISVILLIFENKILLSRNESKVAGEL